MGMVGLRDHPPSLRKDNLGDDAPATSRPESIIAGR
jgi:hypothetical protein